VGIPSTTHRMHDLWVSIGAGPERSDRSQLQDYLEERPMVDQRYTTHLLLE
jgi:hypothetical protein